MYFKVYLTSTPVWFQIKVFPSESDYFGHENHYDFFFKMINIYTRLFPCTTLKNTKHSSIIGATNWRKSPEVPTISQKRSSLDVNVTRHQRQIIIPDIRTEQVTISIDTCRSNTDLDT